MNIVITAKCSEKQRKLIENLILEAEVIIANAENYANIREAEGKIGHATRIRNAVNDLKTWIDGGIHDKDGGASVWISAFISCKNSKWLICEPK